MGPTCRYSTRASGKFQVIGGLLCLGDSECLCVLSVRFPGPVSSMGSLGILTVMAGPGHLPCSSLYALFLQRLSCCRGCHWLAAPVGLSQLLESCTPGTVGPFSSAALVGFKPCSSGLERTRPRSCSLSFAPVRLTGTLLPKI